MSVGETCSYRKPDGSRCRAKPLHNLPFCFFHSPSTAVDRQAARRAGGIERTRQTRVLPEDAPDRPLNSTADIRKLLADTINHALRGELDARVVNSVAILARILLQTITQTDGAERLARVESILASQGMTIDSQAIEIGSYKKYEEIGEIDDEGDDGQHWDRGEDDYEEEDYEAEEAEGEEEHREKEEESEEAEQQGQEMEDKPEQLGQSACKQQNRGGEQ